MCLSLLLQQLVIDASARASISADTAEMMLSGDFLLIKQIDVSGLLPCLSAARDDWQRYLVSRFSTSYEDPRSFRGLLRR